MLEINHVDSVWVVKNYAWELGFGIKIEMLLAIMLRRWGLKDLLETNYVDLVFRGGILRLKMLGGD